MAVQQSIPNFDEIWRQEIGRAHQGEVIPCYTQFEQELLAGGDRRRKAIDRKYEDDRATEGGHWTEPADYARTEEEKALAGRAVNRVIDGIRLIRYAPGVATLLNEQLQQEQPDVALTIEQEYAQLLEEKLAAEAIEEQRKARMRKLEEAIASKWTSEGVTKMNVSGVTLFLQKDVWVRMKKDVDESTLEAALRAAKLEQYMSHPLTLRIKDLSGYNRELGKERIRDGEVFRRKTIMDEHPELQGLLDISESGVKLSYRSGQKPINGGDAHEGVELEDVATT